MCDCYNARCEVCGKDVPMHLGDYNTERNEVEVYCNDHWRRASGVVFVFEYDATPVDLAGTDAQVRAQKKRHKAHMVKAAVVPLTLNALENMNVNHPNSVPCEMVRQDCWFGAEAIKGLVKNAKRRR